MFAKILAFALCTVIQARPAGDNMSHSVTLSYEDMLRAVKAGEFHDLDQDPPAKTKFEHALEESKILNYVLSQFKAVIRDMMS